MVGVRRQDKLPLFGGRLSSDTFFKKMDRAYTLQKM